MKQPTLLILTFITLSVISCTENQNAKNFGGSAELKLPPNKKLVNVTWKNDDFWYLTRKMQKNDIAETYVFKEQSSFGVWEGSYTIIETKSNADTAQYIITDTQDTIYIQPFKK